MNHHNPTVTIRSDTPCVHCWCPPVPFGGPSSSQPCVLSHCASLQPFAPGPIVPRGRTVPSNGTDASLSRMREMTRSSTVSSGTVGTIALPVDADDGCRSGFLLPLLLLWRLEVNGTAVGALSSTAALTTLARAATGLLAGSAAARRPSRWYSDKLFARFCWRKQRTRGAKLLFTPAP